jgi:long-chain acyl-CoA synthetase
MSITAAEIASKRAELTAEGGIFEIEDMVVDGFSYRTFKHAPKTLIEILQSARGHGDIDFMVYEEQRYTYSAFYGEAELLAAALQATYGISKGDRVAIAMRNNPQWVIAFTAAILVGAIVVPVNSWGKREELQYALTDSGARLLVCDEARLGLIEGGLDDLGIDAIVVGSSADCVGAERVRRYERVLKSGDGLNYTVDAAQGEDECLILYTSGSTGFPKGVVQRHIAVCQSLMNMFFLGMLLMELEGARELRGGAKQETPMLTVPLFHATGLLSGLLLPLQTGQKTVMMYKWDTLKALQLIQEEKITGLTSVPAVLQELFKHPEFDTYDTSSLMRVAAAGAATPAGLPELIQEKIGQPSRSTGWGMTETISVGSTMSGAVYDLHPDSAGIVAPIVDMRFVDSEGNVLSEGETGEIEIYSICCTPGYWEKPEANADTFDSQRWMKTGDVGRIDEDGYLYITGRIKEIVIRGAENIYPGEIENAAYELEVVQENVVFGVPDEAMGEELVMVAFGTPGKELTQEALRAYLKLRLAGYKIPKYIQISPTPLPQNVSGKLNKLVIKQAFVEQL